MRRTELKRKPSKLRRTPLGHCTPAQKARVQDRACLGCSHHAGECHPAHVIDRAQVTAEQADDERAVVPLCFDCHREYDAGDLDISVGLEPMWRDSWCWAVESVGFFRALRRITNHRWVVEDAA